MSIRNTLANLYLRTQKQKFANIDYQKLRNIFERDVSIFTRECKGSVTEDFMLGTMPAQWVSHQSLDKKRIILYMHGGGYFMGSIKTHHNLVSYIAKAANAKVLLFEYRLAPEHRYPASLNDSLHAYNWLLEEGYSPDNIVLVGDSAGGGLVLATLMKIRDNDIPKPKAAILLSPWVDLTLSGQSVTENEKTDCLFSKKLGDKVSKLYVNNESELVSPYVSPLFGSLEGFPPMKIYVSNREILYSEALEIAKKAKAENVKVEVYVGNNTMHVWQLWAGIIPEANVAVNDLGSYIQKKLV